MQCRAAVAKGAAITLIAVGVVSASGSAGADDTKRACAQSAERGQRLRDEGKPLAARADLVLCSRAACPTVVRAHCARWLEQVESTIPTVVFHARAGAPGHEVDVADVSVAIDGVPTLRALDGQPRRIEPGAHTFAYARAGSAPIETHVLLAAGEKNRVLSVDFPDGSAPAPAEADAAPAPAPAVSTDGDRSSTSVRPAAWVFAAVAVVGGASFAYFGLTGKSDLDSLRDSCAGHCTQSSVSSAWDKLIVADVSLAVGLVSAGLATWLFATPRHGERTPAPLSGLLIAPGPGLGPGLGAHGQALTLGWHGTF